MSSHFLTVFILIFALPRTCSTCGMPVWQRGMSLCEAGTTDAVKPSLHSKCRFLLLTSPLTLEQQPRHVPALKSMQKEVSHEDHLGIRGGCLKCQSEELWGSCVCVRRYPPSSIIGLFTQYHGAQYEALLEHQGSFDTPQTPEALPAIGVDGSREARPGSPLLTCTPAGRVCMRFARGERWGRARGARGETGIAEV